VIRRRHLCFATVPAQVRSDELHVLVHGAGVDHRYWDWPIEPERYSYVDWATERGIVTLNIDRIGCGQSSRPLGTEVTLEAQSHTLAQIIEAARGGHEGVPPCGRAVLIGHSMGSVVCGATATDCDAIDAVVLTGYLPVDGTTEMGDELFDFAFSPALDALPHLRGLIDESYLAAREDIGVDELRYWRAQTDPAILSFESLVKGPATRAELADAAVAGPMIRTLTTPAVGLVGQHDALLIDGALGEIDTFDTVRRVAPGIGPNFDFSVVLDTGHMLNLHRNAHDTYTAIERWLKR
jgi:pimeloyl-ACP methyl ester carboxylesterase